MKNNKIRILHISDIHYSETNNSKIEKKVLYPLLERLEKECEQRPIDLMCITGDLIDRGGMDSETPEKAFHLCYEKFIKPLTDKLNLTDESIVMCPGNHDIVKNLDSERAERTLKQELNSKEKIDKFQSSVVNSDYIEDHKRVLPYKNFEKSLFEKIKNSTILNFSAIHLRTINGLKIGINCLNSVWRYYNDDSELYIGSNQIDNQNLNIFSDFDIAISLSHNNPNTISKNESKFIENKLAETYKIQLYGHTHDCDMYTKSYFGNEQYFVSTSRGLLYSNTDIDSLEFANGFSIIEYDNTESIIQYYPFVYSKKRNEFIIDNDITGDEKSSILIPLNKSNNELHELHEICDYISKSILSTMDELMLSNGTDTIAPQSFEELFVEPTLTAYSDDDKKYQITSLLQDENNYAILGQKESGKTVLLYYFVKYYIEQIHQIKRIPIYLDSKEKINNLETKISHVLGIKPSELTKILPKYQFTLIIDNYDYKNTILEKKILDLKEKYSNIKIIISFTISPSGEMPLDFSNSNIFDVMNLLELKSFSHKQISSLANKWFVGKEIINDEKEEQIEKFLLSFELPRTPMSISMFLWILEKQKDYQPVNQSTMLENFIEQLLNKHDIEQESYNQFDYRNKEYLLRKIARKMFDENNNNYSIEYSDLISFTINYFNEREFDFNAKSIIEGFIKSGLFLSITDGTKTFIRFRFNCFFQFFLMKNMEDEDFKKFVLEEKNYLCFCDEINLYTGIKRNCSDILDIIVDRMDTLFADIQNSITKEELLYDSFFETNISIADQINPKKVKEIRNSDSEAKEKFEKIQDNLLQTSQINENISKKDFNMSFFEKLTLSLNLGLNVLRNTEEVDRENYKLDIFVRLLKNVLAFSCLNKVLFIEVIKEKYESMTEDKRKESESIIGFIPLIMSQFLEDSLASTKLVKVFDKYLNTIINSDEISQIEKFLTVFLYIDSKGKESRKILNSFIKQIKYLYIKDSTFFKLFFYHVKSKNEKEQNIYIDAIANVLEKREKPKRGYIFNKAAVKKELQNDKFLHDLAEQIKNE